MKLTSQERPTPTFFRDKKTGRLYIHPIKKAIRTHFFSIEAGTQLVPANGTATSTMFTTEDTHVELFDLSGRTDDVGATPALSDRITVNIRSNQLGWDLMNRPIRWNTFIGSGRNPHFMSSTLFVPASQSLQFRFTDTSGGDVNVQVCMGGRAVYWQKFDSGETREQVDDFTRGLDGKHSFPYWLTTDTNIRQTVANFEQGFPMSIPTNADFEAWKWMAVSDDPFDITLIDSYSGQILHNSIGGNTFGLDSRICMGDNLFAREFADSLFVGAKHRITARVSTPVIGGAHNDIFFVLAGRLIPKAASS